MLIILCKDCLMKINHSSQSKIYKQIFVKLLFFWIEPIICNIKFRYNWIIKIRTGYYNFRCVGSFFVIVVFHFGTKHFGRMIFSESLPEYMGYRRTRTRHS